MDVANGTAALAWPQKGIIVWGFVWIAEPANFVAALAADCDTIHLFELLPFFIVAVGEDRVGGMPFFVHLFWFVGYHFLTLDGVANLCHGKLYPPDFQYVFFLDVVVLPHVIVL